MAQSKPQPCSICGTPTLVVFNIDFKATPVCEDCASSIFLQQATWYVKEANPPTKKVKIELKNKDPKDNAPVYKAKTVKQLFAMITGENKERWLKDFTAMVKTVGHHSKLKVDEYIWTDDQK